jgi:DNA-binding transcriptional ArsR family regulator
MSVGELVAAMGLAQSTVSQHLKILAEVRFVLVEPVGTARHYRINDRCIAAFPTVADVLMGRPAPASPVGG